MKVLKFTLLFVLGLCFPSLTATNEPKLTADIDMPACFPCDDPKVASGPTILPGLGDEGDTGSGGTKVV